MGERHSDVILKEFTLGVKDKHAGKVGHILASMTLEDAEQIVPVLRDMFADALNGEEGTEEFLRKVIKPDLLDARQLAVIVLACIRKEPVEFTLELANQLISISGVPLPQLAGHLRGLIELEHKECPRDALVSFWKDTFTDSSSHQVPTH